jgi:hypothetical protein|tara:strand:+ start:817 stop:1185 length:369 start_codon:yes stop_codon:yes gene_type:complete
MKPRKRELYDGVELELLPLSTLSVAKHDSEFSFQLLMSIVDEHRHQLWCIDEVFASYVDTATLYAVAGEEWVYRFQTCWGAHIVETPNKFFRIRLENLTHLQRFFTKKTEVSITLSAEGTTY